MNDIDTLRDLLWDEAISGEEGTSQAISFAKMTAHAKLLENRLRVLERKLAAALEAGERDRKDAESWRTHSKVMREATKPDALHIALRTDAGGKVWTVECVLDTSVYGRGTILGTRAVVLAAQQQAEKLFAAIDAALAGGEPQGGANG